MSETGAVVHIVGADGRSGKLLRQIVLFIGNLGRYQHPDTVRTMGLYDRLELVGGKTNRLIPSGFFELIFLF